MPVVAWLATMLACLLPAAALADWHESSSEHFVLYGEHDPKLLQRYSERLELFHAAMATVLRRNTQPPSPSNRVTVFIVPPKDVLKLYPGTERNIAGFYVARAGQSVAIVPRLATSGRGGMKPETVLLHEYAHHFMWASNSTALPRWFVEGFAEFFAGASFEEDKVGLGTPAAHRGSELAYARRIPIRALLEYDGGASQSGSSHNALYGQSWALFHYLQFAPEQAGAIVEYQRLLASGTPALAAAEAAFGDLDALEDAVQDYIEQRQLKYMTIKREALKIGPIAVRPLSAGEAAMMPVKLQSRVGVSRESAPGVAAEARKVAALHPDNAAVLTALAEAEFDAGNDDAAIAAADRALALDPGQINAHLQKGFAMARKAQAAGGPAEAWKQVRAQWIKANKVEHDHPIPLREYYQSFLAQGTPPTANATQGLEWAMQLAPFDGSLRWMVVQQMERDGRYAEAAATLRPLAYSPHPGQGTEQARRWMDEIQAKATAASGATGADRDSAP